LLLLLPPLLAGPAPAADPSARIARPTPVRDADAVCAKCHQRIFRSYLQTPMANASGLATERPIPGGFFHTPSGVEYKVSSEPPASANPSNVWLTYRKPSDPEVAGRERLDYFLGSGHLGLTYLYTKNNYLLESPVAYYPDLKTYDMKPGLDNVRHMPGALAVDSACLRCHMSAVQHADPGTDNRYAGLPFLHSGITCESCHGDTARHVATGGKAAVVNPVKLDPARRDSTCVVCHLEGAANVERPGRSALDFQPGQDITEYLSYFVIANENTTRRAVSEIEQLDESQCKRVTGAAMSCMSCHDPHRSPAAAERTEFYRNKCLACHTQPKFANAHHTENPDCTSCHMPKTGAKNIAHVAWTDHRIRQHPERDNSPTADNLPDAPGAPAAPAANSVEIVPVLPATTTPRDLALAWYDLSVKGKVDGRQRTKTLLAAAAQSYPNDPAVLQALGIISEWNGDSARSAELYKAVLKQDPLSLTANTNLGTLFAKSGNLEAAAILWRPAFDRNQDNLALGQNLATVECLLGSKDRAIGTLRRILIYNPDTPQVRNRLKAIETGREQCATNPPKPALQTP
jgi:predicted CXXCH cytochrome family protein